MADVNGVFLWYQCFKKTLFIIGALLISLNEVYSLICYCAGHCPSNQPNGSCFARPNSQCFSAVEQVYNQDTGLLEDERTYGCLPPEENGFMQCKGHLVPHQIPKSIACCSKEDWCNKHLKPNTVVRTTTPSPMYQGELMSYNGPYNLIICLASVSVCIAFLAVVVFMICYRLMNQKESRRGYLDVEKKIIGGETVKDLIDRSNDSSGSGSGVTLLVQRTIGKQVDMIESIGRGRFGEVWKARLRDEYVAVKVFYTSEEASWSRETDIYKTVLLRHENILGFVAADIRGTGSYTQMLLITDYLELGSLHDYLKVCVLDLAAMLKLTHSAACGLSHLHVEVLGKQGFVAADIRGTGSYTQMLLITDYLELGSLHDYLKVCVLDLAAMLKLTHSAACGLSHLHVEVLGKQGKPAIAHRDIKSRNILVKRDRTCAIADFGLAVKYKSDTNELDVAANTRVGTKRYMPPEVLDETIDTSQFEAYRMADMYSFALVLWEIARRCIVNDTVEEYQLPYYDCVPSNPSFEDMKKVVCVDQTRPAIPKHWSTCETMQIISKVMQESWKQNPGARLTALRVKKTLLKLEGQNKNEKVV
ncbi:hypothetical protein NPIL_405422 [Nephila pilipes]|uniref:receptor protein serine/threonine kinase n=1 Tax=Nephila pilipes TaxID=299642 RepID=A0A8X6U201_NEPPI|nr:hypothetical protein NPIL_405422 [Nephila pilipes]